MITGPSTQHQWVTKPAFRPCSWRPTRSQAPLCLCTQRTMSIRAEGTIGRLRYRLGGDRPSQTARLARSRSPLQGSRLEPQSLQGGIPPSAPPNLAARVRCLPPILYKNDRGPMPGYSQAPRGLSVQSRVPRIFTRPSISPGPLPRQRPSRYTFRAGRNLPDKEFRYLRTLIVRAAVHWGFGSALARLPLTVQHRAGVSPYTSACALAETCVFGKQSLGLFLCGPLGPCDPTGAPLLPKLRGDFAEFLSKGSPARLRLLASPTCVGFSTGTASLASGFSRQCGCGHFGTEFPSPSPLGPRLADFPTRHP